uniref:Uncharacterized protein n=1 Tax=Knipowitschia caucasica TaxID=637954 RepID=A0AAV2JYR2_KNICA
MSPGQANVAGSKTEAWSWVRSHESSRHHKTLSQAVPKQFVLSRYVGCKDRGPSHLSPRSLIWASCPRSAAQRGLFCGAEGEGKRLFMVQTESEMSNSQMSAAFHPSILQYVFTEKK